MIVEDVRQSDAVSPYLRDRVCSLVGVPLQSGEGLLGVIHAGSVLQRSFSSEDVTLLSLAADRIGMALQRTRLHEMERVALREAEKANQQLRSKLVGWGRGSTESRPER